MFVFFQLKTMTNGENTSWLMVIGEDLEAARVEKGGLGVHEL